MVALSMLKTKHRPERLIQVQAVPEVC